MADKVTKLVSYQENKKKDPKTYSKKDPTWKNLGQIAIPPEMMEGVVMLRESKLYPEYKTNNDVVRDAIFQLLVMKEEEESIPGMKGIIAMLEMEDSIAKAEWFKSQSLMMITRMKALLDGLQDEESRRELLRQATEAAWSIHPDYVEEWRKIIDKFS